MIPAPRVRRSGQLLGLATLVLLFSWGPPSARERQLTALSQDELQFLERHWRRPITPQGASPSRFSAIERSLRPESCGACHPAQYADWKTSLHSGAMGPGVRGQLGEMIRADPESADLCLSCHAPLAEQRPDIAGRKNPDFDPALQKQGIVCAACHVRQHERFGPPRRDGRLASDPPSGAVPHNGVTRTGAFLRSQFCASCHQFAPDGFALNGKLLENTLEEWKASPAARRGVECQSCHMPDRRHLWRGIHDPDMVKAALGIQLTTAQGRYRIGEHLTAALTIESTNVGHSFPTYVTPRVLVRMELVDSSGRSVAASVHEQTIGREVTLDLSREVADTRIPPGGRLTLPYRHRLDRAGLRFRATITVEPDAFYTRFFESLLDSEPGAGASEIRQALEATRRSPFVIFDREIPLT